MILHNARFYIDDSFDNPIKALRIESGLITELLSALPQDLDPDAINLQGHYVYPGFIDTHTHSFSGGIYSGGVNLSGCSNHAELISDIKEAAKGKKPGSPIFAWNFDEAGTTEKSFPSQDALDAAAPRHLVLLRRIDGHSSMISSNARSLIPEITSQDTVLSAEANDLAANWFHAILDDDAIIQSYHNAAQEAIKGGFTTIHTMIGDAQESIDHYELLKSRLHELPIEYILYPQSFNIDAALKAGAKRIGGCILADGSIGSHTAALSSSYQDALTCGQLYHNDAFWKGFITRAHRHGLQVCVHCIGDAAISQINNIYLQLQQTEPADLRHQLIHCEITPDELLDEIQASKAVPVMQPAFDLLWGGETGFYALRLGLKRSGMMNRFGSMQKRDIRFTGSSDWYITPLNIAKSIYACINHHNPEERISPQDAIRIYTVNAAWLSHDETRLGQIKAGFQADFSVLDTDLCSPFHYRDVQVKYIIKKGKQVNVNTSHSS